jgi:hypothetical protein
VVEAGQAAREGGVVGRATGVTPIGAKGENPLEFARKVVGTGAEIASYLAPVGVAEQAIKGAITPGIKGALGVLGRTAVQGAKFGAVGGALGGAGRELAQDKTSIGRVLGAGASGSAFGGALGGALPIAGAGANVAGRAIGRAATESLGLVTGAGENAVRETLNNPKVIQYIREYGGDVNRLQTEALGSAKEAAKIMREQRASAYVNRLKGIKADTKSLEDQFGYVRQKALSTLTDPTEGFGIGLSVKPDGTSALDFSKSTIVNKNHQDVIQRAFNELQGWSDTTPAGLDTLKRRLNQIADNIPVTERGGARAYLSDVTGQVSDVLKQNVDGYEEMTRGYREASEMIEEIEKALSLSDKTSQDTAIRKLSSTMRRNFEFRLEMLKALEQVGGGDIQAKLAAGAMSSFTPKGLAGALSPFGLIGSFSIGNIPGTLAYLAATSPRLMAEFLSVLRQIKNVGTDAIPFFLKKRLETIMREAEAEGRKMVESSEVKTVKKIIPKNSFPGNDVKLLPKDPTSVLDEEIGGIGNEMDIPKLSFFEKKKLDTEIERRLEKFRQEAGLMAEREGAGVTHRNVKDAVGETMFVAKGFSLNKAKGSMRDQAKAAKKEAHKLLYENDPEYRALVDQQKEG